MQPGIYDIPASEYHAGPCPGPELSNSVISTLLTRCPKHAWMEHPKLNPEFKRDEDHAFDLGTAAHNMLLEGANSIVVVDASDWRTKAAKEERDAAHSEGKTALLRRHYDNVLEMVQAARAFVDDTQYAGMFDVGEAEQTVIWQEGNVWCKARPDLLIPGVCLDYKTTSAKNPHDFMRSSMMAFGYDTQDAWYRRGLKALGKPWEFLFLVQEDTAPYLCYFVKTTESMRELADAKIKRALHLWSACLESDSWPGYGSTIYQASAPLWALTEELGNE